MDDIAIGMKKSHHTVPKCYLENFTDEKGFVWVLDTKDKIFKIKPENILVENHFYRITLKDGEKSLIIEDTLANIEGAYATIYREKLSNDKFLTDEERAEVSIFIAALLLRTKPYRENMRRMLKTLEKSMEDWGRQFEKNPKAREIAAATPSSGGTTINLSEIKEGLENIGEYHSVGVISNLSEIAQLIFNMKWAVWKNTGIGFVTCDDPLTLLRPASIKEYGPNAVGGQPGLIYEDVELTLPLSKDRLLLAGWILNQNSYLFADDDTAQKLNHRTISNSSEKIITNSESKANAIKERYMETAYKHSN